MPQFVIEAQKRIPGGKNVNRRLRASGWMPAVLYGPGKETLVLSVNPEDVEEILHSDSGQNTIFTVKVEGTDQANAMVREYQLDPVRGNLIHADFFEIAMDKPIEVTVDIEVVGEAEGVKIGGGIMDVVTKSVDVECLPGDIPESIEVDVAHLKINENIRVKNLVVDPKVTVLTEPELVVVTILPPVKEEEPVEEPAETAEPEVIKKGKAAEEEEAEESED